MTNQKPDYRGLSSFSRKNGSVCVLPVQPVGSVQQSRNAVFFQVFCLTKTLVYSTSKTALVNLDKPANIEMLYESSFQHIIIT